MTTPVDPAPWLPAADVLGHLGIDDPESAAGVDAERARLAAAAHVERARPDLFLAGVFTADAAVRYGAALLAARLYARKQSPAGLASYGEFGPAAVLRLDPDIERLVGIGRYAKPRAR